MVISLKPLNIISNNNFSMYYIAKIIKLLPYVVLIFWSNIIAIENLHANSHSPNNKLHNNAHAGSNPMAISVTISGTTSVCQGTTVASYTATVNGGTGSISYQWVRNGFYVNSNVGTPPPNVLVYSPISNGDVFYCIAIGTNGSATSNSITVSVTTPQTFTVSTNVSAGPILCQNTPITFTASSSLPMNSYQWQMNGTPVSGATNASFTTTAMSVAQLQSVAVTATTTAGCVKNTSATGSASVIPFSITPVVVPSVTIASLPGASVCSGTPVTFTASPINGGSSPTYQWKLNGNNVAGATASSYTSSGLTNGQQVSVAMGSTAVCPSSATVTSNIVTMTVNANVGTLSAISGPTTITQAGTTVYTASAANATGYTWNIQPASAGTIDGSGTVTWSNTTFASAVITVSPTGCNPGTQQSSITVIPKPPLSGGTILSGNVVMKVGDSPGPIVASSAFGGTSSSYTYKWQSASSATGPFSDINGATDKNYVPPSLTTTTYYQRKTICGTDSAYTNTIIVRIGTIDTLNRNYIRTRTISKSGVTDTISAAALTDPNDVAQSTQYFDGLGRPEESVVRGGSPLLHDIVTRQVYDPYERESVKLLPFISNSGDGNYKSNGASLSNAFNTVQFPGEQYYYAVTDYESSPLNRVQNSYSPGMHWVGNGRSVGVQYVYNTVSDSVQRWNISLIPGSIPTDSGAYPAGRLYKNITKDEHGHLLMEYKDKEGLIILKKVQLADNPGNAYSGWLCTYYVYDALRNLRFVLQPKAVEWLVANSWTFAGTTGTGVANELCFRYEYDQRNRMVIKKIPGAGEIRMVYDARDRLVMTQDSTLRSQKKWQIFCYDALNRQDTIALMTDVNHYLDHTWHMSQAMSSSFYPPTATYPTEVVTQLYYDSYNWVTALGNSLSATMSTTNNNNSAYFYTTYNTSPLYAVQMQQYPSVTGMSTGSRTKVIGTSQFLYNVPFYDDHGRVIQVESSNYTNGIDYETTQYDFSGKPLRKLLVHKKNGVNPMGHVIGTKYTYDAGGRQTSIRNSMDGPEQLIDTMMYNELGQLRAKYFAGNLDSLVYDYNIRGWLTGINKKYLTGTASNYFGMELGYDGSASGITGYATPQFNGNIAGTVWKSAGDGINRKYDFSYDNVNRLTGAVFTQYNGSTFAASPTIDFGVPKISYDANGNILSMSQRGYKIGGSSAIDSLTYGYFTNTNRLRYVYDLANDTASKLGDFHYSGLTKDTVNTPDYTYDGNGSLTADKNKGIRSIHYNFLNLPDTISMTRTDGSSKGNIVYQYDALGTKWAKIVTDSTVSPVRTTTTLYIQGFQYQNDTIQFVAHEEGRTRYFFQHYLAGDSSFKHRFDYFEKDHLGNTRVILTDQRDTGFYAATMEAVSRGKEKALFYNIDSCSYAVSSIPGYPADGTTSPNDSVARVNGSTHPMGPAILLKVMSGDSVTIATKYFYKSSGSSSGNQNQATNVIASLAQGLVGVTGGSHGSTGYFTGSTSPVFQGVNDFITDYDATPASKPKAYLNWMILDNQFTYDSAVSGAFPVTTADALGSLSKLIKLKKGGYLYIWVSNETKGWDVFFDNLTIYHYTGPMVEENHYYPFGLTMAGISDKALKSQYIENKYRSNGGVELQSKEFSDGTGLEAYDANFRMYDAQIGRFLQIDPLSDLSEDWSGYAFVQDNPISFSDPMGLTDSIVGLKPYAPAPIITPPRPAPHKYFTVDLASVSTYSQQDHNFFLKYVLDRTIATQPTWWQRFTRDDGYVGKNLIGTDVFIKYYSGTPPVPSFSRFNPRDVLKIYRIIKNLQWSSRSVAKAAKLLLNGAREVTVKNKEEAEELFLAIYLEEGYAIQRV